MTRDNIEEFSCRRLEQAFRAAFDDVVMMPNLVISLTNGHRLPTAEIDCTIVCNSGVFLFEIKGWKDAHVSRASRRVCGATASAVGDQMGVGPGATIVMTRPHQPSRPACFAHAAADCHRQCHHQNLRPNHPKQAKHPNPPLAPAGS